MKKRRKPADLRQRITRFLMPLLALLIVVGGFALHSAVRKLLISQFNHALLTKVRTLTSFNEPGRVGINLGFTEHPLPEFHGGPHAEYFQLWLSDGSTLAKSPSLGADDLPRRTAPEEIPEFWRMRLPDGRVGRAVGVRLKSQKSEQQTFTVELVLARGSVQLNRVLGGLASGIAASGALLLLLAWYGVRRATASALQPLSGLASQVATIDANSLTNCVTIERLPPDLIPIAGQINDLMARLEAALQRERRFAGNAAHELLTPVSELRLAAENALEWPNDPIATSSLANEARDLSLQMEHIVRTLLALSRAEAKMLPIKAQQCDLAEIIDEVLVSLESRLTAKNLKTEVVASGCTLMTDAIALRSILSNLLLNAAEYSAAGSIIQIEAKNSSALASIVVSNRAPSRLSPDEVARFAEPFWRGDLSHQSREHAGLGLALTRAFVEALGGTFSIELQGADTVVAKIILPQKPMQSASASHAHSERPVHAP
ncbi:MAG TPA: HAMP domain-containing sensor histidine kinase [Verrucomicrobiae bacterium]